MLLGLQCVVRQPVALAQRNEYLQLFPNRARRAAEPATAGSGEIRCVFVAEAPGDLGERELRIDQQVLRALPAVVVVELAV